MTATTNLDVRGFTATEYEYLTLGSDTRNCARWRWAGAVVRRGDNSGFLSVFVQILTRTGKPKVSNYRITGTEIRPVSLHSVCIT
jgi:hypothetical protein